jgi:hypothetical protein
MWPLLNARNDRSPSAFDKLARGRTHITSVTLSPHPLPQTIPKSGKIMSKRLLLVIGALVLFGATWAVVRRILPSSIDYRGQKIKLTKFYLDYDDYKNDPYNIDPSETERVQRLVSEAPIAHSFASRKDAATAVFEVKFPGYGAGGFGGATKDSDGSLNGFVVEIPRTNKSRYFIFRNHHGNYTLVDDFVMADAWGVETVQEDNGNLVYSTASGEPKLVHPILANK